MYLMKPISNNWQYEFTSLDAHMYKHKKYGFAIGILFTNGKHLLSVHSCFYKIHQKEIEKDFNLINFSTFIKNNIIYYVS